MSKKKDKGKKMGLAEFLGDGYADAKSGYLPRAPRTDREEMKDRRGGGRYGDRDRDDGPFGRGGRRDDEEEAPSAADQDNMWRRGGNTPAAKPADGPGFRGERSTRFGGESGDNERAGDQWRRGPAASSEGNTREMPFRRGQDGPPRDMPSRADEEDQWRRGPAPSREPPMASRADEDDKWRRGPSTTSSQAPPPPRSRADDEDQWRRSAAPAPAPAPVSESQQPSSNSDNNWRRSNPASAKPVAPAVSAERQDNWRKVTAEPAAAKPPLDAPERPRLQLKKKGEKKEVSEEGDATEKTEDNKGDKKEEENNTNKNEDEGLDKWDKLKRDMEEKRKEEMKKRATADTDPRTGERRRMFGDDARDTERENIFSRSKPRGQFEQRDNPGFQAFGSRRDEPQRGGFHQSQEDRERAFAAFSGGGGRDRDREERGPRGGSYNNPAFNQGQRDREERGPRQGSYNNPVFGSSRNRDREEEGRENMGGRRGEAPKPDMKLLKPTSLKNWAGDDSDSDEIESQARPKLKIKEKTIKMTDEEIFSHVHTILKEFFLMQRTKETIAEIEKTLDGQKYQVELIRKVVVNCFGQTRAELKLASSLLGSMKTSDKLKPEDFSEAFDIICKTLEEGLEDESNPKHSSAKDNLQTFTDAYKLLEKKSILDKVTYTECALKLLKIENTKQTDGDKDAAESASMELDKKVDELISSNKIGSDLASEADSIPAESKMEFGARFIGKLLRAKSLCTEDAPAKWAGKSNYGEFLATLLYVEEPNKVELEGQLEALNQLQSAFHDAKFPRDIKGNSLFEKAMMELYNHEVIVDEAYSAWKDVVDTPGKTEAIIQTTSFLNWLEEDDESESEEEED